MAEKNIERLPLLIDFLIGGSNLPTANKNLNEGFEKKCIGCGNDEGKQRVDNGLKCGVHCDECFEKMIRECRGRSW